QVVADTIEKAGSAEPADIIEQLATTDYTGISGQIQMDAATRRANKAVALVQMDGTAFTCLEPPDFPDYVPPV
ncbi:MAG TPA: hypothetical protein VNP90_00820, partial [Actinomycetota bacterium]|nr:hypothetical protein [Actinomycetota bacterium]